MHNFTTEDLLQYAYNETSTEKTAAIKMALEADWSLREKLEEITAAKDSMNEINLSPRQQVLDNILRHAEKSVSILSPTA